MTEYKNNEPHISDVELDLLLTEWAEEEMDVPEGFHEALMTRLRTETETTQAPQKKGIIVSLSERFANKKAWVSAVAAAALVLCCLPVLQDRQDNLAGVENSAAQMYEMKSRTMDSDGIAEEPVMMNALLEDNADAPAATGTVNGAIDSMAKQAAPEQAVYDASYEYANANSRAEMTLEEQLKLAQDNLAELEAHLSMLDDSAETQSQREALQSKIDELKAEIKALEEEINTVVE